jgi:hypothetical protein
MLASSGPAPGPPASTGLSDRRQSMLASSGPAPGPPASTGPSDRRQSMLASSGPAPGPPASTGPSDRRQSVLASSGSTAASIGGASLTLVATPPTGPAPHKRHSIIASPPGSQRASASSPPGSLQQHRLSLIPNNSHTATATTAPATATTAPATATLNVTNTITASTSFSAPSHSPSPSLPSSKRPSLISTPGSDKYSGNVYASKRHSVIGETGNVNVVNPPTPPHVLLYDHYF